MRFINRDLKFKYFSPVFPTKPEFYAFCNCCNQRYLSDNLSVYSDGEPFKYYCYNCSYYIPYPKSLMAGTGEIFEKVYYFHEKLNFAEKLKLYLDK